MMITTGATISSAAFAVGYASVPQFTRDYRRMFSLPPSHDMKAVKKNPKGGEGL